MTVSLNNNSTLNRHTHIGNYQKALTALFEKKKTWNYLKEQRKIALKRKKELSQSLVAKSDEVIYH